jgi:hypothetical protein
MFTKKDIGFIGTIFGGLLILILAVLNLSGIINLSSDWFWLVLGLILVARGIFK